MSEVFHGILNQQKSGAFWICPLQLGIDHIEANRWAISSKIIFGNLSVLCGNTVCYPS
jgi:hypothetical protein